jgi:hypothetical protein
MKAFTLVSTLLAVVGAVPATQDAVGEFFDTTERTVQETSQSRQVKSSENGVKILARMSQTRLVI